MPVRCAGLVLLVLGLLSALLPSATRAQEADAARDQEAHALFEAGRTAYASAHYADALEHFQRAYDLSGRPDLLYNVAQCQDRLRHDAEAIAAFEQYVAAVPDSPHRAEIEARVAILREGVAAASAARETGAPPETSAPTEPPAPAADAGPGVAPWILVIVGGVVAIGGAVCLGIGFADVSTVEHASRGTTYASVMDADQQAPVLTGIGWGALGLGAAGVLGGIVWALVGGGSHDDHVRLDVGPGSLSVAGSF